jgi:hypothetical protein
MQIIAGMNKNGCLLIGQDLKLTPGNMKIQKLLIFSLFIPILFLSGCTANDEADLENQIITLGKYSFVFPPGYKHIEEEGIDSQVGRITNGKMDFHYDYGYYEIAFGDLPADKYEVTEEEFDSLPIIITRSLDHPNGYTILQTYKNAVYEEDPLEISKLTLYASGLTLEEQEVAVSVFRSVTIER